MGFFINLILPAALWALGSTQSLKQKITTKISKWQMWPVRRQTALSLSSADFLESWESYPPGTHSACSRLYRNCLTYIFVGFLLQKYQFN